MLDGFIGYEDKSKRNYTVASVSPKTGRIGFSEAFVKRQNLADVKFAYLMFNPKRNQIGIEFSKTKEKAGMIKIQFRKNSGFYIGALGFLEKFDIRLSTAMFFEPIKLDGEDCVFIIDLNKPVSKGGNPVTK